MFYFFTFKSSNVTFDVHKSINLLQKNLILLTPNFGTAVIKSRTLLLLKIWKLILHWRGMLTHFTCENVSQLIQVIYLYSSQITIQNYVEYFFFFFFSWTDPMQAVLQSLERQHEEEKQTALERQRLMYEQELQQLRKQLTPDRQSMQIPQSQPLQPQYRSWERLSQGGMSSSPSAQHRLRQWSEERWGFRFWGKQMFCFPKVKFGTWRISCNAVILVTPGR